MKSDKILLVPFLLMLITACSFFQAPIRTLPQEDVDLRISVKAPEMVERGKKYSFIVTTDLNNNCFGGIRYLNLQDKWINVDFEPTIASQDNKCSWEWEIPIETKSGWAEFRAYVEKNQKTGYSTPIRFCIDVCQ